MTYENIQVEREDGITILTINRPHVHNALDGATVAEIGAAFDDFAADNGVRAIIVTGAGPKAFAAGADINQLRAVNGALDAVRKLAEGHDLLKKIQGCAKPVIMAVNGLALGGGTELALAGDFRIAAESASLGLPEIDLGIFPAGGGTQRLPRLVGRSTAKWMIFTGERVTAPEALRIGLVDRVVADTELMAYAREFAHKLAAKAPAALALAKRAIDEGLEVDLERGLSLELTYGSIAMMTEDRIEGTSAFLEKRPAAWKGR